MEGEWGSWRFRAEDWRTVELVSSLSRVRLPTEHAHTPQIIEHFARLARLWDRMRHDLRVERWRTALVGV